MHFDYAQLKIEMALKWVVEMALYFGPSSLMDTKQL